MGQEAYKQIDGHTRSPAIRMDRGLLFLFRYLIGILSLVIEFEDDILVIIAEPGTE